MVLSEKNSENVRNGSSTSSGKRSSDNSPDIDVINSNLNIDSNIDETGSPNRIKVGRKHQAICPELSTLKKPPNSQSDRALLVWRPHESLTDEKLDDFLTLAIEKFNYNREQALGMLFWHKYDIDKAIKDLENFMPYEEEWSPEEKILFDQALVFHEKQFSLIRQMLPDKTIASLVRYYYHSKKARPKPNRVEVKSRKQTNVSISTKEDNLEVTESNLANQEDKNANQRTKKWLVSSTKPVSGTKGNGASSSVSDSSSGSSSGSGNGVKSTSVTKAIDTKNATTNDKISDVEMIADTSIALSQQSTVTGNSDKDKFQIRQSDQSIESVKRKLSEIQENNDDEIEEIANFYQN